VLKDCLDGAGDHPPESGRVIKAIHREGLPRASLAVREHAHVVAVQARLQHCAQLFVSLLAVSDLCSGTAEEILVLKNQGGGISFDYSENIFRY